jgi:hypothetical protein
MDRIIGTVIFAIACISLATSAWADISEATFTPQGSDVYRPIPVSEVEVFVYKPDFKFKIIGVIEARGMAGGGGSLLDQLDLTKLFDAPPGEKEDIALAMKALKEEAAKAGANGVLIIQSIQVRLPDNATERKIKAAAIRRIP